MGNVRVKRAQSEEKTEVKNENIPNVAYLLPRSC